MTNNTPLLSIIIPAFNRGTLIGDTLKSIQKQTYTHWECIIVDDGSTDTTEEVIHAFAKTDSRISYHKRPEEKPKGANACRNYGFEKSTGSFINWFDSDDLMHPEKLEKQLKVLQDSSKNYCVCHTEWYDNVKGESLGLRSKTLTSASPLDDYLTFKIFWTTIAPLWKRDFIDDNTLRFDEELQQSQEYEFHARVLAIDTAYAVVDKPLCTLVQHENNMSHSNDNRKDKLESNLKVRLSILKNMQSVIQTETKEYLLAYIFSIYKQAILNRNFTKANIVWKYLVKASYFVDGLQKKRSKNIRRWFMARPIYYIFGKGHYFLEFIR